MGFFYDCCFFDVDDDFPTGIYHSPTKTEFFSLLFILIVGSAFPYRYSVFFITTILVSFSNFFSEKIIEKWNFFFLSYCVNLLSNNDKYFDWIIVFFFVGGGFMDKLKYEQIHFPMRLFHFSLLRKLNNKLVRSTKRQNLIFSVNDWKNEHIVARWKKNCVLEYSSGCFCCFFLFYIVLYLRQTKTKNIFF